MALSGCTNGLVVTALVTLLLLPAQYYLPDIYLATDQLPPEPRPPIGPLPANATRKWFFLEFPAVDLFLTVSLLLLAVMTYLCDWIQRKLMERRLMKLNQYLGECVQRLHAWDSRQEQLEGTLRMVQNATSEYNLLLYLLLRYHRLAAPRKSNKDLDHFTLLADDAEYDASLL